MDTELREKLAEALFNQSCVYHGDLRELGWSHEYTQHRPESNNCRFHVDSVIKAAEGLGYELSKS